MQEISNAQFSQVCEALRSRAFVPYPLAEQDAQELLLRYDAMRAGTAEAAGDPLAGLSLGARQFYYESRLFSQEGVSAASRLATREEREETQCELFALFADVFGALTGFEHRVSAQSESALESLVQERLTQRAAANAVTSALSALARFYIAKGPAIREHCAQLGGIKVLVDKGEGFERTVIRRIRCLGLYVDTQLLPDPFTDVAFEVHLKGLSVLGTGLATALRRMLQLEPLVKARLPVPPFMLFPSRLHHWRTMLPQTPQESADLRDRAVARALGLSEPSFEAIDQKVQLAPDEFCRRLIETGLLPDNGFSPATQLQLCISAIELSHRKNPQFLNRSKQDILRAVFTTTVHHQLQYYRHIREFAAHPSASDPRSAQLQKLFNGLPSAPEFTAESKAAGPVIQAMQHEGIIGVTNATIPLLVELLRNQENLAFRARLEKLATELQVTSAGEAPRAIRDFNHELSKLMGEHEKTAKALEDRTRRTAYPLMAGVAGGLVLGAMPELYAFVSPALTNAPMALSATSGAALLMAAGSFRRKQIETRSSLGGVIAGTEPEACDL